MSGRDRAPSRCSGSRNWLRILAAFMVVQVLGLAAGPALHFGLGKHVLCLEHGQMEHAHGGADQGALPVAATPSQRAAAAPGNADRSEHEGCTVPAVTRAQARDVDRAPDLATPVTLAVVVRPGRARQAAPSIALLAQAPKLSPPS